MGKAAIDSLYEKVRSEEADGTDMSYSQLEPFRVFGWLLEPEQKSQADKWLSKLVPGGVAVTVPEAKKKGSSAKKQSMEQLAKEAKKRKLSSLFG